MVGTGASPEGNKPFLDLLDIDTMETTRLWQSSPPYLESIGSIMSDNNDVSQVVLLTRVCEAVCWEQKHKTLCETGHAADYTSIIRSEVIMFSAA